MFRPCVGYVGRAGVLVFSGVCFYKRSSELQITLHTIHTLHIWQKTAVFCASRGCRVGQNLCRVCMVRPVCRCDDALSATILAIVPLDRRRCSKSDTFLPQILSRRSTIPAALMPTIMTSIYRRSADDLLSAKCAMIPPDIFMTALTSSSGRKRSCAMVLVPDDTRDDCGPTMSRHDVTGTIDNNDIPPDDLHRRSHPTMARRH